MRRFACRKDLGPIDQSVVININYRLSYLPADVRREVVLQALADWESYDGDESLFESHIQNVLDLRVQEVYG